MNQIKWHTSPHPGALIEEEGPEVLPFRCITVNGPSFADLLDGEAVEQLVRAAVDVRPSGRVRIPRRSHCDRRECVCGKEYGQVGDREGEDCLDDGPVELELGNETQWNGDEGQSMTMTLSNVPDTSSYILLRRRSPAPAWQRYLRDACTCVL